MAQKQQTVEVSKILDLIDILNNKVQLDDSLTYVSEEQYDKIIEGVKKLTINIYNHKDVSEKSHNRLDELTDIMTSIASLDFSKKAFVSEESNHLDYIAIGLNLLSYQLQKQIQPLLQLNKLIDATEEPVIITDFNYVIQIANPSAEKLFGISKSALIGIALTDFIADFSDFRLNSQSTRMRLGINKNDVLSEHLFEVYNLGSQNNEESGWSFICIDRILENTSLTDLTKKYDIDLNRIQHDMKSPVKNIYGLSDLGQMTDNCDEKVNYFKLIDKCIRSVENHIKDLFSLLTITGNKEKKSFIHFSEVIDSRLADLNYLPGFSSVKFNFINQSEKPFHSNLKLINSIFHNLLSNAVKYKRSNVLPEVNVCISDVINGVSIEIKDNGIGILPEHLKNVFQAHFRATTQSDGKGLGLYVLNESIKELGGNISLESEYGIGSTFKIYIPNIL